MTVHPYTTERVEYNIRNNIHFKTLGNVSRGQCISLIFSLVMYKNKKSPSTKSSQTICWKSGELNDNRTRTATSCCVSNNMLEKSVSLKCVGQILDFLS